MVSSPQKTAAPAPAGASARAMNFKPVGGWPVAATPMRSVNLIVIHCSATPNGRWVTSEDIDSWHQQRGFARNPALIGFNEPALKHIGYHFVIYTTGAVRIGRGRAEVGMHAYGYNLLSLGVCMIGMDRFSLAQWDSLRENITGLLKSYPNARVCGHRDLSPDVDGDGVIERWEWLKECPCFSVEDWLARGMQPLPENILADPPAPSPHPSPGERGGVGSLMRPSREAA